MLSYILALTLAVLSFNGTLVYAINSSHATGIRTTNITAFNTHLNTTGHLFFNSSSSTEFHHSIPTASSGLNATSNNTTYSNTRMDYNSSTAILPDSRAVSNSSHNSVNLTQSIISNSSLWSNSSSSLNLTSVASNITGPYLNLTGAVSCLNTTLYSFPNTTASCNGTQVTANISSNTVNTTAANITSAIPHSFGKFPRPKVLVASPPEKSQVPKAVFAHYMVGNVNEDHAHQDIDSAAAIGLDGFALNIQDPQQPFVRQTLNYMFDYARDNHPYFKLFFSLDVWAEKAGGDFLSLYDSLIRDFKGHDAYKLGPNGYSFISTFSAGDFTNDSWIDWKNEWADEIYFVPDFDGTLGYYEADPGWWAYWGPVVDGIFSWDSVWPNRSETDAGDLTKDQVVLDGAVANNKTYMVGLSALQYKNSYDANYYREGELNLPARMEGILSMDPSPDFDEIISWNDGPESHYIGFLWLEQNNDTQPGRYANELQWSHTGWQPTITSFIDAFRDGLSASEMTPPSDKIAVGALWYKTILQSSVCPENENNQYSKRPDGFDAGSDNLNWMVVLPNDPAGMQIRLISNGQVIDTISGKAGLNYGASGNVQAGAQRMELLDSSGNVLLASSGGRCISAGCPDCIYNMNYQVVELTEDNGSTGTCPYSVCQKAVFAHYMVGNVYEDHAHQDIDDAAALGFDGFALNVADPTQPFVRELFDYMFDYARDNHPNFKLFLSMDLWGEGNAFNGVHIDYYDDLIRDFKGHDAWYKGPNGFSFISSFSSGGLQEYEWNDWKAKWAYEVYLVPDIDDTQGYNTSDPGWWNYWGPVIDGTFSWETAWPKVDGVNDGDATVDILLAAGHAEHQKSYMMPLSALQYKNAYGANYWRHGETNLPSQMVQILSMETSPDFVEVMTWNDGPESHYIGNLWLEQNNDTQPFKYANQAEWSHTGWQPLISSFITAYKAGLSSDEMRPPSDKIAVGSLWYKTILQSATCPSKASDPYSQKPDGFDVGSDHLIFAVVLPDDGGNMQIRLLSNGNVISTIQGQPGMNYGTADAVSGCQRMELVDSAGNVLLAASGGRCISDGCPDCIYNMNYQVLELTEDTGATCSCPYAVCEKAIFAHYMVGNIYEEHAHTDIDDAVAMGLDGFALNVADPSQPYVRQLFNYMFDYTRDNHPTFKLFISMDLWALDVSREQELDEYHDLLRDFKGHDAWYKGPNGYSFVSTFSSGGLYNTDWQAWRDSWAGQVYLVPDFDDTSGYNTSDPGWWEYWGSVIDGSFSWETAWPNPGSAGIAGDVAADQSIIDGHNVHSKSYMMPLSALQYKNAYDTNYYRRGELNLPARIDNMLSMNPGPSFVEVITWNDGPESHYIGNLWLEQNNDTQPGIYASQEDAPHTGWQPIITSFITALKAGQPSSSMTPPEGEIAIGALWYKTILQSAICPASDLDDTYSIKPNGFEADSDQLNWAVVLPSDHNGMQIRLISNGVILQTIAGKTGLNYGAAQNAQAGQQRMELLDSSGNILLAAAGGRCISADCPDCIYNMNPQVVPLGPDTNAEGACPVGDCGYVPEPAVFVGEDTWSSQQLVISALSSENGQKCRMGSCGEDCIVGQEVQVSRTKSCSGGKPICCPPDALPVCQWRGGEDGSFCHGQCHADEVTLFFDKSGDGSTCVSPGQKVFCCKTQTFSDLIAGCSYAGCGKDCSTLGSNMVNVTYKYDPVVCAYPRGGSGPVNRDLCCPASSHIENCHWVGKGGCDQNNCNDHDLTLDIDSYGIKKSTCNIAGRSYTLCCNPPTNTNPFLPVSLEDIFPDSIDSSDVPDWELQLLGSPESPSSDPLNGGPADQGFGFIVIDGPQGTVTNLNRRDGSDYEFLECPTGEHRQQVRIVCINNDPDSNCDEIYLDGVEGTVIKMPQGCGEGSYAVAHSIEVAKDQSIPSSFVHSIPDGGNLMELDLSYDFGLVEKVKRTANEIYIRVDYSNIPGYWDEIVNSGGVGGIAKRSSIDKRFFSPHAADWGSKFFDLDHDSLTPFEGQLSTPIYGEIIDCESDEQYLELGLSGTASASARWGMTFIGTLSPFNIFQAYGFLEADISMNAQVTVQAYGALNIESTQANVFPNAITEKPFSQPGILNIKPNFQVGVTLSADIDIDADFNLTFSSSTPDRILQTYPSGVHALAGSTDIEYGLLHGPGVGDTNNNGSMRLSFLPTMNMNVQFADYNSGSVVAQEVMSAFSEIYVGVSSLSGCRTVQVGVSEAYVSLESEADTLAHIWAYDEGSTMIVPGSSPQSMVLENVCSSNAKREINVERGISNRQSDSTRPSLPHDITPLVGALILGAYKNLVTCILKPPVFVCISDLLSLDPSLSNYTDDNDNGENLNRRSVGLPAWSLSGTSIVKNQLDSRGPNTGKAENYPVYNANGNGEYYMANTPTYPNGNNGASLATESDNDRVYAFANLNCTSGAIRNDAPTTGTNAVTVITEHPLERVSTRDFGYFAQVVELDIFDGQGTVSYTNRCPPVSFDILAYFANQPYQSWPIVPANAPGGDHSAVTDAADALGSSSNPTVLANLETGLNGYKAIIWGAFNDPTADGEFSPYVDTPTQANTESALSLLRAGFGVFNYMNDPDVHQQFNDIHEGIRDTWVQFDGYYNDLYGAGSVNMECLWTLFINLWMQRIVNRHRQYMNQRLDELTTAWNAINNPTRAQVVERQAALDLIADMRGQINTVVDFDRSGLV